MPIERSLDFKSALRTQTCTGTIDADEIIEALHEIYSGEGFSVSHHSIWDFRNCAAKISSEEMWKIITYVKDVRKGGGGGKVAFVVSHTSNFGLARMYELTSEHQVDRLLKVFSDFDDALKWLWQA